MRTQLARRTLSLIAATALVASAGLVACGKKEAEEPPSPTPTPSPTATPTKAPPTPSPTPQADPWPLTGLPGPPEARPALSIKVENSPAARPQTGLDMADIVWEEVVEGGISRFVATFHSQLPEVVGPIRSVRPMDGPIAGGLSGLLVFSGGQYRFIQQAVDAGLQVLGNDQGAGGFFRDPNRSGEHSLMGRPADFLEQANPDNQDPPVGEFAFAKDQNDSFAGQNGEATSEIKFRLSSAAQPNWTWDTAAKVWLRSENGVEALAESGQRLSAANLVGIKVEVRMAGGRDAAGSQIPEMILVGSGSALVASGGKAVEVNWEKASAGEPMVLTGPDGEQVTLAPGTTWIELMPVRDSSWTLL